VNAYLLEKMAEENVLEIEVRLAWRELERAALGGRRRPRRSIGRRLAFGAGEALIGLGGWLKALGQPGYHGEHRPAYG
jgi:hypothetical protein